MKMNDTIAEDKIAEDKAFGFDPWTAAVRLELTANPPLGSYQISDGMTLTLRAGYDSLWLVVRGTDGSGGIAFRTTYAPGANAAVEEAVISEKSAQVSLTTSSGRFQVSLEMLDGGLIHWTTMLTPAYDLVLPFSPPDIYPLDENGDPTGARGTAHAGQPKMGAAVLFLTQSQPPFGSALYLQNFSALNPLFETLGTKPDSLIGGVWPQLGFRLPASDAALPAGQEIVVSDAFVSLSSQQPVNERQAARLYLDGLAAIYPHLTQPQTEWRDWAARAADTLTDLQTGDGCLRLQRGQTFALPYLGAEEPDSMVQLALTLPLREYEDWTGDRFAFTEALRAAVPEFYDVGLGAMRRYLPDAPESKDRAESDSWYLYHPLLDLARLAKRGDTEAHQLLLGSLEHTIRVARHFEYRWPIKFNMETLDVLTDVRKPGEPGQSDVGGIYAAVMIEVWDLTGEEQYLEEAKAAIQALRGYRFAVGYQFNITAIGAAACLRLWEATQDDFYQEQCLLLLASFFQHTTFYDCKLGTAKFFPGFFSVLCLHDAQYAAIFEAFESFAAFHQIFSRSRDGLPESARLLMTEYCRHLLNRAWYYYPGELPQEALATEIRNGRLDQNLAIPLEDLYPAGDPAGAVGQEVYGAGAAFVFVARTFTRLPEAPFQITCDYPLTVLETAGRCAALRVHGVPSQSCRLRLISSESPVPGATLTQSGQALNGSDAPEGYREYQVPGGTDLELRW